MTDDKFIIRPEVEEFSQAMERILRQNDDKGGWRGESSLYFLSRLMTEVGELSVAIESDAYGALEVQHECVDVANFAMMIFDILKTDAAEEYALRFPVRMRCECGASHLAGQKCPSCGTW